jgi:Uma2 family endonuclease
MVLTLATPISEIELVPGSAIRLNAVTWQGYLELLQELGENRATRLTYSDGVVEIRMPGQLHEAINRVLAAIILTLAEVLDLAFNNLGSTTLNRPDLAKGIEPDSCFFIQNAQAGQGMATPTDLPPDLAIEVDIASSSESKLPIYAAMGVPEVWLYQQEQLKILALQVDDTYVAVEQSVAFPQVSDAQLNEWLVLRKTGTDLTVVKAVRKAIALTPSPSPQGEGRRIQSP